MYALRVCVCVCMFVGVTVACVPWCVYGAKKVRSAMPSWRMCGLLGRWQSAGHRTVAILQRARPARDDCMQAPVLGLWYSPVADGAPIGMCAGGRHILPALRAVFRRRCDGGARGAAAFVGRSRRFGGGRQSVRIRRKVFRRPGAGKAEHVHVNLWRGAGAEWVCAQTAGVGLENNVCRRGKWHH